MERAWEDELASFLGELSAVQTDVLDVLSRKRECIVASDLEGMRALEEREQDIIERLQGCQQRRGSLLERASREGLPSASVQALATALPPQRRAEADERIREASSRARLLEHQSLTNWVLVQRTLLHLSQMLEILATGGRRRTTYGNGTAPCASGGLMDRAA